MLIRTYTQKVPVIGLILLTTKSVLIVKKKIGLYGEMMTTDCGCTIVQKTHGHVCDTVIQASNGSRIVIIRNPYEALRSYRNFMSTGEKSHVQQGSDDHFNGSGDWLQRQLSTLN